MNDPVNYAWPVTSVNREDYLAFESWFSKNRETIGEKKVIIWGAGIRGTEFSVFFTRLQYKNICFTDSNADKWGGMINEFPIISPDEANDQVKGGNAVIVISTEKSREIEELLDAKGLCRDINYYVVKTNLYRQYVEEYSRRLNGHVLLMSDCEFLTISVHDTDWDTLEDMVKSRKLGIPIKCLAMHGMGMRSQYMIIREQIITGQIPKVLGVMINFDTLTGKQHLLPRSQHTELFEMICKNARVSDEFEQYCHLTEQRSRNVQVEFFTERNQDKQESVRKKSRNYFMLNYLYRLDLQTEGVVYLREIIKLAEKYEINLFFFIPPVNYVWGREVVGETFDVKYRANVQKIIDFVENKMIIDFSYMFTPDYFAEPTTADETVNEKGRKAMANVICDQIVKMLS